MRAPFTHDERLIDVYGTQDRRLDASWSDKFSARSFEELVLAIGDPQVPCGVDLPDIPGVIPSVAQCLRSRGFVLVISEHDARPAHQNLTVGSNADLDTRNRFSNSAVVIRSEEH